MSDHDQITHVQQLSCNVDAPRTARHAAADMLMRLGCGAERGDDLALAVSELVTNAVLHSRGADLELRLEGTPSLIRVEVSDHGTLAFDWPIDEARRGGLTLVQAFSDRSGIVHDPTTCVWCEFDLA